MKHFLEAIMKTKYKIYCDMDGVLTDYERAKSEYKGKEEDIWHQEEYWMNMKWMSDGKKLWNKDELDYISKVDLSTPLEDDEDYSKW